MEAENSKHMKEPKTTNRSNMEWYEEKGGNKDYRVDDNSKSALVKKKKAKIHSHADNSITRHGCSVLLCCEYIAWQK
jgi:hypothetical protein